MKCKLCQEEIDEYSVFGYLVKYNDIKEIQEFWCSSCMSEEFN